MILSAASGASNGYLEKLRVRSGGFAQIDIHHPLLKNGSVVVDILREKEEA